MNLFSLLVALTLFSGIFLSVNQWISYQRKSAVKIYQSSQALSIAMNQKYRQFLDLNCQAKVEQNALTFQIYCEDNKVEVHYPLGKISL